MTPAVQISDLSVVRGDNLVLPGLTATIESGRVYGLMGPSGCGKSTLMRSIVGVQKIASGRVEVLGLPAGSKAVRARVGYVTQAASVYGDLTVRENLQYFAKVAGVERSRVDEVIEQVDLGPQTRQAAGRLSGGQRSRVSLAGALLGRPELLVLDEPTVGLDPILRESLWNLFHEIAASGATLLVSSHVMDEASRCDHLLLMREGHVIASLSPADLLARTGQSEMEAAFLQLVRASQEARR